MATTALAELKTPCQISAPPDAAQLRSLITGILMAEYGDHAGLWEQAARRATTRIMAAVEGMKTGRL